MEPKPSHEPFLRAARVLKVHPHESMYVGDRILQELKPAKEVCMWTTSVKGVSGDHDDEWVDWALDSIRELPQLVEEIQTEGVRLRERGEGFVIWVTGIPSSGKSSIARRLSKKLLRSGYLNHVLETDAIREELFSVPTYFEEERNAVYEEMFGRARRTVRNGGNVIFAATGYRKAYRMRARALFAKYLEAYVKCPLEVAISRDSKGRYRLALENRVKGFPGLQESRSTSNTRGP